jgi:hypothetical protein
MSTHGPLSQEYRDTLNDLAKKLDRIFNGEDRPRKVGFALLVFEFGRQENGRVNYISNANRADMLTAMKEYIARAEGMDLQTSKVKQ